MAVGGGIFYRRSFFVFNFMLVHQRQVALAQGSAMESGACRIISLACRSWRRGNVGV